MKLLFAHVFYIFTFTEQRDQSVLYASKDSKDNADCQHTIQRLIRHLRQSNREFLQKYQKICQSTYIEQRDALLNPQLVGKRNGTFSPYLLIRKNLIIC